MNFYWTVKYHEHNSGKWYRGAIHLLLTYTTKNIPHNKNTYTQTSKNWNSFGRDVVFLYLKYRKY